MKLNESSLLITRRAVENFSWRIDVDSPSSPMGSHME